VIESVIAKIINDDHKHNNSSQSQFSSNLGAALSQSMLSIILKDFCERIAFYRESKKIVAVEDLVFSVSLIKTVSKLLKAINAMNLAVKGEPNTTTHQHFLI